MSCSPWSGALFTPGRASPVRRSAGIVKTKGEGGRLIVGPTKSARQRVVDLDAEAVDALRRYRSWRAGLDLRLVSDDSLIFGEHDGGHLNPDRLRRRSPDRSRWPGASWAPTPLPMIRVHDLRHPCATRMLANGMSVKVVFERWGI